MKKKNVMRILAIGLVVAVLAVFATQAFAAWLGSATQVVTAEEAITPPRIVEAGPSNIKPGETYTVVYEVKNTSSSVTYGMEYGSSNSILFNDWEKGKASPVATEVELTPKTAGGGTGSVGETAMIVDRDGPGPIQPEPYLPWTKVNIRPDGTHWIGVNAKIYENAYPGNIRVYFEYRREMPAPESTSSSTSPMTVEELLAQINSLTQQLNSLQQQSQTPETQLQIAAVQSQLNSLLAKLAELNGSGPVPTPTAN